MTTYYDRSGEGGDFSEDSGGLGVIGREGMEDWLRKEMLQALDAHFLGDLQNSVIEKVLPVPPMFWAGKAAAIAEPLELCWSRLDYFPGTPRALLLTAGCRSSGRNVFAVGFNLDSGQLLELNMARGTGRIRLKYDDDGRLVQGKKHVEALARAELDDFLLSLCRLVALKTPTSSPPLGRN